MKTFGAIIAVLVALAQPSSAQKTDVTGEWDMTVVGAKGTLRFVLAVTTNGERLQATLIAPNGEKRAATIELDGAAVTIRFDLDNPGEPVRVVMTGTVDGDAMKGRADFGGRANADWAAARKGREALRHLDTAVATARMRGIASAKST